MENIDNFLNKADIVYCESSDFIDFGFGNGCAGLYSIRDGRKYKGNGLKGTDFYGKGSANMDGYGDGNANKFDIINDKNKGYGKPNIKD